MRKLTECFDQFDSLATYILADDIDVDQYRPMLNKCNSLDDFEDQVCADVTSKVHDCKKDAEVVNCSPTVKLMLLASIEDVDIDKIVKGIMSCYDKELRIFKLESRLNKLYKLMVEKKKINERSTTSPHEGDIVAFNIATKFNKDDLDIDSTVDAKNSKDAWTLRLVYNDGNKEDMSLVKPKDDKDDYVLKSNKDKLKVKFSDDDSDDKLSVPQEVIDHIAKHIEQADKNAQAEVKSDDRDLASEISFEIKKAFPKYDMEVIEGDNGSNKWSIEIVYPDGKKDKFTIMKLGKAYIMKSSDMFVAKYTLDELKDFPKKMQDHIQKHLNKATK